MRTQGLVLQPGEAWGPAARQGVWRAQGDSGEGAEVAEKPRAAALDPGHSRFMFKKEQPAL